MWFTSGRSMPWLPVQYDSNGVPCFREARYGSTTGLGYNMGTSIFPPLVDNPTRAQSSAYNEWPFYNQTDVCSFRSKATSKTSALYGGRIQISTGNAASLNNMAFYIKDSSTWTADIVARTAKTQGPSYEAYDSRMHTRAGVGGNYTNAEYVNCGGFRVDANSQTPTSSTPTIRYAADSIWCCKNCTPIESAALITINSVASGLPTWNKFVNSQMIHTSAAQIGETTISGTAYKVYVTRLYGRLILHGFGNPYSYAWISRPQTRFIADALDPDYMYMHCMDECITIGAIP